MITITIPEYKEFYISKDRFGYTIRKQWVTKAGKNRNDILGCVSNLGLALKYIDTYLNKFESSNDVGTFTNKDLIELRKNLLGDAIISPTIQKYIERYNTLWDDSLYAEMPQFKKLCSELNNKASEKSQIIFDFSSVFKYTRVDSLVAKDSKNFCVKVFYEDSEGEIKHKEAWFKYYNNVFLAAKNRIFSEVYSRLTNNTLSLDIYLSTLTTFISAFVSDVTELNLVS